MSLLNVLIFLFLKITSPPRSTLFPYTTLFRSPSIRGLRVRVKDVLELLAAGVSREEILVDFPYLEDGDITAALERSEEHTSELQSLAYLVCRLLLEKKKNR